MNITINNLSKKYRSKTALNNLSLEIGSGLYGLLGPNGAGKTTLMRILATLLEKSEGTVLLDGTDIGKRKEIRRMIGYLPQEFSIYPSLSVYEAMDYLALLSELKPAAVRKKIILGLLEKVNLQHAYKTKVKALSGGMKRRLGIAQALLCNPKLLIVDEPTAGLDPEERIRFRNLLSDFAQDRTVLLSTHIVSDVESACESLAVLKKGSLLFKGNVSEFLDQAKGSTWTMHLAKTQWEKQKHELQNQNFHLVSCISEGEEVKLRFLSPVKPYENAEPAVPAMEDAYMKLVGEV